MIKESKQQGTFVGFEPSLSLQFLPRCARCGHRHPAAYNPPLKTDKCPSCGRRIGSPGKQIDADAVVTLPLPARALLKIASWLRRLQKRIEG